MCLFVFRSFSWSVGILKVRTVLRNETSVYKFGHAWNKDSPSDGTLYNRRSVTNCFIGAESNWIARYYTLFPNILQRRRSCVGKTYVFVTIDVQEVIRTYLLTPWCRVLLEKLTGLQLVKKFPAFHGTRMFITALTSFRHLSLSWASPIQSIYPHPTTWRSGLILSAHLRLGLPR